MHKYNCSIIGYGYMGEIRKKTIDDHPDLNLVSIYDPKIKNESKLFINSIESIFNENTDIIFVCTPNKLIPDLVVKSLKNGKHVFCEKPPGLGFNDIKKIQKAEKENLKNKLMFGFNHRYHPGVMKAKSIVDSGELGKIVTLRGVYGKSGGNNFEKSWRNKFSESGGGILLDQGIHMLDLFHLFLGKFSDVKSYISNAHWKFEVEDNAMLILKNKLNQLALLHSSSTAWKHMFQLNINLEEGYLNVDGLLSKSGSYGRETLTIGRKKFEDESDSIGNPAEEIIYFDKDMSWHIELDNFLKYIIDDTPVSKSSSDDAFNVMEIIDKCYKDSNLKTYRK